jgi:hypothetical protein
VLLRAGSDQIDYHQHDDQFERDVGLDAASGHSRKRPLSDPTTPRKAKEQKSIHSNPLPFFGALTRGQSEISLELEVCN